MTLGVFNALNAALNDATRCADQAAQEGLNALNRLTELHCPQHNRSAYVCRNMVHVIADPAETGKGLAGHLTVPMNIWLSGTTGKLHMTTDDPRFRGAINIALKPGLKPDRTFREALGLTREEDEGDDS